MKSLQYISNAIISVQDSNCIMILDHIMPVSCIAFDIGVTISSMLFFILFMILNDAAFVQVRPA